MFLDKVKIECKAGNGGNGVIAFRRENSPFASVSINLKATIEDKEYIFENLDTKSTNFGNNKLNITLENKRSSVIIDYKIKNN